MNGKHDKYTFRQQSRRAAIAVYDWVGAIVVSLTVIVLLITYLLRIVGVDGDSMVPTLQHGDRLLLTYSTSAYTYGDIVVVDRYTNSPLIKRVIAVGGDSVEIIDGQVCVNDVALVEPYIQGVNVPRDMNGKVMVPDGFVFVMGDNRTVSKDSRMKEIGMVSIKDIVGKAQFCIWPPSSMGAIYE